MCYVFKLYFSFPVIDIDFVRFCRLARTHNQTLALSPAHSHTFTRKHRPAHRLFVFILSLVHSLSLNFRHSGTILFKVIFRKRQELLFMPPPIPSLFAFHLLTSGECVCMRAQAGKGKEQQ